MSETTATRTHLGVCVVGHVDAGKSTTTGHLLLKLGEFDQRELDKYRKIAEEKGKKSFEFAFVMDTTEDEREHGVTKKASAKKFLTPNYYYTIVDCPGHKDYIGNMITGSSTAQVAMLMFPAELGGFEKSIASGEDGGEIGLTRQHAKLINLSGIKQVICCINKMDSVDFSESRFNEIKDEASRMLAQAGYGGGKVANVVDSVPFIPISGLQGYNLIEKCDKMPWYTGFNVKKLDGTGVQGHTVLDALNDYVVVPKRDDSKPFRMPVSDVLPLKIGTIVTGCVEQGVLKANTEVKFVNCGAVVKAFTIEMHQTSIPEAVTGDNIGINVKGLDKNNMPKRGDVMVLATDKVYPVYEFTAQVVIQDHNGQLKASDEETSFTPNALVRTGHSAVKFCKINWKQGKKSTNGVKTTDEDVCKFVEKGDAAEIRMRPQKSLYVEKFTDSEGFGRVALMDSGKLVALGRVTDVTYLTPELKAKLEAEKKAKADAKLAEKKQRKKK